MKNREHDIIVELRDIECELSPENLHCDGEISPQDARRRERRLNSRRASLIRELGRTPTFAELYPEPHG